MSIAGKFSDSGSPTTLGDAQRIAEARRGEAIFKSDFTPFCEAIGMTVGELQKLPPNMVLTIMLLRMFTLLSAKIIQLDVRLRAAEGGGERVKPSSKEPPQ